MTTAAAKVEPEQEAKPNGRSPAELARTVGTDPRALSLGQPSVDASARPARSVLQTRLGNLGAETPAGATLKNALRSLLGVDIPDLETLALDRVDAGKVLVRFVLDSPATVELPLGGKEPVEVEIPETEHGIALEIAVEIGRKANGDGVDEPVLKRVVIGFAPAKSDPGLSAGPVPDRVRLERDAHPLILNPTALDRRPTDAIDDVMNALKDAFADVRFVGASLDEDGRVRLLGDMVVAGVDVFDLTNLAERDVPRLNVELKKLARGDVLRADAGKPAPAARAKEDGPPLSSLVGAFKAIASRASWSATADLRADKSGATAVTLASEGDLSLGRDLTLEGRAHLEARGAGAKWRVSLEGRGNPETRRGAASIRTSLDDKHGARDLSASFHWDHEGMRISGFPVERILPVKLEPWAGPDAAPAVGSPAFATRVRALLGDEAPLVKARNVEVLGDGDALWKRRLELIGKAGPGDTVLLQTYIFKDDVTGAKVIDALVAAKARGADVKVLMDALGTVRATKDLLLGPPAFGRLRDAGIDVALASAPDRDLLDNIERILKRLADETGLTHALGRAGLPASRQLVGLLAELEGAESFITEPELALAAASIAVDAAGELASNAASALRPELLAELRAMAGELLPELPNSLSRDHRKQLIVYGPGEDAPHATVMLGGNNVGDDYQLEPDSPEFSPAVHGELPLWNDLDLKLEGTEIAASAARLFASTWERARGEAEIAEVPALPDVASFDELALHFVDHAPVAAAGPDGDNHFSNLVLATLEGAGRGDELVIENPYFLPLPELRDAMIEAARRGARIRIVTNGLGENNDAQIVAGLARRFVFDKLVGEPGIEVYETHADVQPIHKKTLAMKSASGHDLFIVGSQNLDSLSARVNRELFVVGGSAVDETPRADNPVVARLFEEVERDTAPDYSARLKASDLESGDLVDVARDYVQSILIPVL